MMAPEKRTKKELEEHLKANEWLLGKVCLDNAGLQEAIDLIEHGQAVIDAGLRMATKITKLKREPQAEQEDGDE